jgi:hypothetical protein
MPVVLSAGNERLPLFTFASQVKQRKSLSRSSYPLGSFASREADRQKSTC